MPQIPRHVIDAVRDATDIVAVVSRHVRLVRRGNSWVGLCPFHQEKTPSFHVVPSKDLFHCFGCQQSGDVFRFLMQIEGLSFVEAVKDLAGPAGITIEERELTPAEARALRQRATLFDVLEETARYYEDVLWTRPEGGPARRYLEDRGLSRETTRAGRLGWAPGGWTSLLDHLHRRQIDPRLVLESGLARERPSGSGHYDAFRERLMFPIRDERGRVMAFGGRILEGDGPKYINTPETAFYDKSKVLYGLDMARATIQRRDRVLVVEGYFDVLSLHQVGFSEAVATCGTALTAQHIERIRRMTRNVVLLLDADEAGQRAAERALPLCLDSGVHPWRLEIPDAKDPDELVRERGAEALEEALSRREPLVEWVVQRKLRAHGVDAMGRERSLDELLPILRRLPDDLVSRVAARLRIHESTVHQRIREHRTRSGSEPPQAPEGWKPVRLVVHLLWLLVHCYGQVADLVRRADPSLLQDHAPVQPVVARLLSGEPVASVLVEVEDPGVLRTLSAVAARGELYAPDQAAIAVCDILAGLDARRRSAELGALLSEVEAASRAGEWEAFRSAQSRRQALMDRERALKAHLRDKNVAACIAILEGGDVT